jgi:hypothetical protein
MRGKGARGVNIDLSWEGILFLEVGEMVSDRYKTSGLVEKT